MAGLSEGDNHAGKFSVKYKDDPNWWTHSLLREGYGKDKHDLVSQFPFGTLALDVCFARPSRPESQSALRVLRAPRDLSLERSSARLAPKKLVPVMPGVLTPVVTGAHNLMKSGVFKGSGVENRLVLGRR